MGNSLHFCFVNCSKFLTIFCRVLKMNMTILNIPSYPPPFVSGNSLTNQIYQKNLGFCKFSKIRENKVTILNMVIPDHTYFFL